MANDALMRRVLAAATKLDRSKQTDRDLLHQFAHCGDESAFTSLVKRHTSLVLGVCRRTLTNGQDAEDACQAVFLILAKKAKKETWQISIANWLYSTARKVSRDARLAAERRTKHERRATVPKSVSPLDQMTGRELLAALDDELERLPAIYREPLVLCHLEGLNRTEVATRMGVVPGTIKIRLERGRMRLADALNRRGIDFGAALIAIAAASPLDASSPRLIESILAAATGSPSGSVAAIVQGVAMSGVVMKVKMLALAVVVASGVGIGLASMSDSEGTQMPTTEKVQLVASAPQAKQKSSPDARAAVPVPEKGPPEAVWMKAFRKRYELKEGEYVKRVAPPYIDERKEYMYRVWYRNKQTPEEEARAREYQDRVKLFLALFLDFDGKNLTTRTALSAVYLADSPKLQNGEK
jgi:RNA polymerase sigma factor (sigma-70 family)